MLSPIKPGKPTTFATIAKPPAPEIAAAAGEKARQRNCLVFSMPGNPVSCMV